MFDNTVTRNQNGQTNARDTETLSDLPVQDETKCHIYLDDFDYYSGPATVTTTNGYTLSGTGATAAEVAGDGGWISLVAATTAFFALLQRSTSNFKLAVGFRTWFNSLVSLGTLANANQLLAGLVNFSATAFTAGQITDGMWFSSDAAGTGILSFNVAVGGVVTTQLCGTNLVAGAQAYLKCYWDGGIYASAPNGRVVWEASGAGVTANVRGEIASPVNFPGATLIAPLLGVKGTSATPTLTADYINVMKDRTNPNATPAF